MNNMQMNPNQYYGSQQNFMPMQNAQEFYQPQMMTSRVPDPSPVAPQYNQTLMNQPMSAPTVPQYNQYGIQNASYTPIQNVPQYQTPSPQNSPPNMGNIAPTPVQQEYQYTQPNQTPFYPNQGVPSQNFPNAIQYGANVNTQPAQNFYNPPPSEPPQMSYQPSPNTTSAPIVQNNIVPPTSNVQPKLEEPTYEKERSFMPRRFVGDYKCSDFPNLFTGPFRYSTPVQRKPFTMKHECPRPNSQLYSVKNGQSSFSKNSKRWELRGSKYYGCFTSRTNGLQDNNCPKVKCRMCPTDKR